MSFKAEALPDELLEFILKNLKGTEVTKCRAVCHRWREIIDSFSDATWKRFCIRDFKTDPKSAKLKSNLSFQGLYKSLFLWSKVKEAEVRNVRPSNERLRSTIRNFNLISNYVGIASNSLVEDAPPIPPNTVSMSNMIEYFNAETMEFISREHYSYFFNQWDENDKMIVMEDQNNSLRVILKSDTAVKSKYVFDLYDSGMENFSNIFANNEVYFLNVNKRVCVARLKVYDGQETVEFEKLAHMNEYYSNIVDFAYVSRNAVNILVLPHAGDPYVTPELKIYSVKENQFSFRAQIDSAQNIAQTLKEFGFCWSNPIIHYWLIISFNSKRSYYMPRNINATAVHTHNHIIIMGSTDHKVHIFNKPYKENGELMLFGKKPSKSFAIMSRKESRRASIHAFTAVQQLDVFEMPNVHRIFILCDSKLYIFDLMHNRPRRKRKLCENSADCDKINGVSRRRSIRLLHRASQGSSKRYSYRFQN